LKTAVVSGFLGFILVSGAFAQTAATAPANPGDDPVVAKVNGYEIKASEVRMAYDDIVGQLPNLPANIRYPFVVQALIERHLLAQVAAKEGVADSEDYKRRLAAYQAKALRDSYLVTKVGPSITDAEIKAEYDQLAAKVQQTERVRARHILVATQKDADDIEAKLKAGAKFEDLAKQYSLDNSKDYGGDLGYFTAPEMVPEFSQAAFALKVGEVSAPVKTQFGWHIIKLEDRKMGTAQPFDQVKDAIRNTLMAKKVQEKLAGLQGTAKVDLVDPDLKKQYDAFQAQQKNIQQQQGAAAVVNGQTDDSGKGDLTAGTKQ
jgi:peptidyl-prolyl cis-trans isomerase C